MLKSDVRVGHGITVLALSGWINGDKSCQAIHDDLRELLAQGDRKFVLDLAEVTGMNSLGLGCIIAGFVACKRHDAVMEICNPSRKVENALRFAQVVPQLFEVHRSRGDAIKALEENVS
jgi:anti-sigma B factor antagonist